VINDNKNIVEVYSSKCRLFFFLSWERNRISDKSFSV